MKFGRNRPLARGFRFKFASYALAALPTAPATCNFAVKLALAILADIMGNDTRGNCTCAAIYHYIGVVTANVGAAFHATLQQVIALYEKVGGYNPNDPSTDQGADEVTVLNYCVENPLADGTKALGWLEIDGDNIDEIKSAINLFEGALLTLELPQTYTNPFPSGDGFTWDVGTPDPNQGHAIMVTGYDSVGVQICTWGMLGTMTWAALTSLCTARAGGGIYVLLTPDMIAKASAKAPNGFDWAALVADFDSMGGTVPIPPPPAPTPAPPGTVVTLAQATAWAVGGLARGRPLTTRQTAEQLVTAALAAAWPKS